MCSSDLRRALARGAAPDTRTYRLIYPVVHEEALLAEAAEQRIDPSFVAALIRQESMFNPAATSAVGARGLMQVMARAGSVESACARSSSSMVDGDEDLLHRVVANLVLNAVQVANGPARVTVSVASVTAAEIPHGTNMEHAVRLQVRDGGPGIPEDIRERLFDPFVSGRPGGSGLGLAIVQRAVQAHHGLVLVDSTPGAGTTFTIFLPAKMIAEDAA